MADSYIDYFEVDEYGTGFLTALNRLDELADLVNVAALRELVQGAVTRVNQELQSAGIQRSDLRGQRVSLDEAAARGRKEIERFHGYLTSLDDSATADKDACVRHAAIQSLRRLNATRDMPCDTAPSQRAVAQATGQSVRARP